MNDSIGISFEATTLRGAIAAQPMAEGWRCVVEVIVEAGVETRGE